MGVGVGRRGLGHVALGVEGHVVLRVVHLMAGVRVEDRRGLEVVVGGVVGVLRREVLLLRLPIHVLLELWLLSVEGGHWLVLHVGGVVGVLGGEGAVVWAVHDGAVGGLPLQRRHAILRHTVGCRLQHNDRMDRWLVTRMPACRYRYEMPCLKSLYVRVSMDGRVLTCSWCRCGSCCGA